MALTQDPSSDMFVELLNPGAVDPGALVPGKEYFFQHSAEPSKFLGPLLLQGFLPGVARFKLVDGGGDDGDSEFETQLATLQHIGVYENRLDHLKHAIQYGHGDAPTSQSMPPRLDLPVHVGDVLGVQGVADARRLVGPLTVLAVDEAAAGTFTVAYKGETYTLRSLLRKLFRFSPWPWARGLEFPRDDAHAARIQQRLMECGVKVLAVDFDLTVVRFHTYGNGLRSVAALAAVGGPQLSHYASGTIFPFLVRSGAIPVYIVSYGVREVILEYMRAVDPAFPADRVITPSAFGFPDGSEMLDNKKMMLEEVLARAEEKQGPLARSQILFVDDSADNVAAVVSDGFTGFNTPPSGADDMSWEEIASSVCRPDASVGGGGGGGSRRARRHRLKRHPARGPRPSTKRRRTKRRK